MLGLASGTVRKYCRAIGLQKTNGQYDIDPETVEEWRYNPPAVAALMMAATDAKEDPLDGPPIKKRVIDKVPSVQVARKARWDRLLAAIREAGV